MHAKNGKTIAYESTCVPGAVRLASIPAWADQAPPEFLHSLIRRFDVRLGDKRNMRAIGERRSGTPRVNRKLKLGEPGNSAATKPRSANGSQRIGQPAAPPTYKPRRHCRKVDDAQVGIWKNQFKEEGDCKVGLG
uniref:Uncharacterized protein n=1 Tax=Trichuris muris TaxID=70415 RepID=A0A5S6QN99_TRIMR